MKKKILVLAYADFKLGGHGLDIYNRLPDSLFEKRLIVGYPSTNDATYSVYKPGRFGSFTDFMDKLINKIRIFLFESGFFISHTPNSEYCFRHPWVSVSRNKIFKKLGDYNPDYIVVAWVTYFTSFKLLRELCKKTGATLIFYFVDQANLTGCCHFSNNCHGYERYCEDCPGITRGKWFPKYIMKKKEKCLKNIKYMVCATPLDIDVSRKSTLLSNAVKYIPDIIFPEVHLDTSKEEARKMFNLNSSDFVVLYAAAKVTDKRKGFQYMVESINKLADKIDNLTLLCLGRLSSEIDINKKVNVVTPGFLTLDELLLAYRASDCFLSTSIADTMPMTVNYSWAVGCPVISFDIGTAHTLVLHKYNGYIAKYKDTNDLVNGLMYIFNNNREDIPQSVIDDYWEMISLYKDKKWYEYLLD